TAHGCSRRRRDGDEPGVRRPCPPARGAAAPSVGGHAARVARGSGPSRARPAARRGPGCWTILRLRPIEFIAFHTHRQTARFGETNGAVVHGATTAALRRTIPPRPIPFTPAG